MSRFLRSSLVTVFMVALATGTAYAQDDDDDFGDPCGGDPCGGDPCGGDPCGGDGDGDAMPDDSGDGGGDAAPAAASSSGAIKAGAKVLVPTGIDDSGEFALGAYIEVTPWVSYQVNEKLSAEVAVPLLLVKPDLGDASAEVLQGIVAKGHYGINEMITADGMVGFARPARLGINPYGSIGFPGSAGDMKVGFGAGASVMKAMDKIHIHAGAHLVVQLDSDVDDDGEPAPGIFVHVPVMVMYALSEKLSAGVATGIYTGPGPEFDSDKGMTVPLVAGAKFQVNPQLSAGGLLGFSSVLPPEGVDIPDTLTLGVFAAYAM
jgi:hypothetical protein